MDQLITLGARTPRDLGFGSKFPEWRDGQLKAAEDVLQSGKPFDGVVMRQGEGKSLMYMAIAVQKGWRTVVLTSTKGLQKQLTDDFSDIGLVDFRGKANYICEGLANGKTCEDGMMGKCRLKGNPDACAWAIAKQSALESQFVTTNYSCWMATNKYGGGPTPLGKFDFMVMDEAHNSVEALESALQVTFAEHEMRSLKWSWPTDPEDMAAWKVWSVQGRRRADMEVQSLKDKIAKHVDPPESLLKEHRLYESIFRKMQDIADCDPQDWTVGRVSNGYRLDPINTASYGQPLLFRGIEKVLLTSGTIRPKTLKSLGIKESDFAFHEYSNDDEDTSRSPLIFIPTAKIDRHSSVRDFTVLVDRIDEIIESRCYHKGIIHTSSFKIRDFIVSSSRYSDFMVSNYSNDTEAVIEKFKKAKAPKILVSPSVSTGYDFPDDCCRWQIIAKIPFPDESSPIDQERKRLDPQRGAYMAMQALVQSWGRGNRGPEDWQEVFVLDNNIEWFLWKYNNLAPPWFMSHYRKRTNVPEASY